MAGSGRSTRKRASSASPRAPAPRPTRTRMQTVKRDTIFTNVALRDDGTVWWEGHDDPAPSNAYDWRGKPWDPEERSIRQRIPIRVSRSRSNNVRPIHLNGKSPKACRSARFSSARGGKNSCRWSINLSTGSTAPSSALRWRPKPLRRLPARWAWCAAIRWRCCRSAATTWATTGAHWLSMGKRATNPPKIFRVNWFQRNEQRPFSLAGIRRKPARAALGH